MRKTCILSVFALMMGVVPVGEAWQQPTMGQQSAAPSVPPMHTAPGLPGGYQGPQAWPAPTPGYQPYAGQPYQAPAQAGQPQYPYPPHHNPFFDEMSVRNFLSSTMDWLLSLPQSLVDRTSNYVDGAFFPQAPATHGQGTQAGGLADRQIQDVRPKDPLPAAHPYVPQRR